MIKDQHLSKHEVGKHRLASNA